ncbi:hypothetical protein AXW84_18515 [Hymenobacter sp. PAMC 26628]|nr:hypothetical protein AXW84_18515 [Hymenobacter sp. PAMC 26628]
MFYFATQLVDGEATVAARISEWLEDADEIDCDQLNTAVGKVATCLANYNLYHVSGTGWNVDMGILEPTRLEAFFQNWKGTDEEAGLFISRPGLAVAKHQAVPAVVVSSVLQAVSRRIETRQQQLKNGVAIQTPFKENGKMPLPTLALILIYEHQVLQRGEQANQLARNAGYNSGDSLYNEYCRYSTKDNRLGFDNDTAQKGRNMISRIRAALPYLKDGSKQMAENEINIIDGRIS